MYKQLGLKNFKAFRELDLELRPLTMLSGMNGMGKSSVLQALLLLRQSYLQQTSLAAMDGQLRLILNGSLVELGTGRDIFFSHSGYRSDNLELAFSLVDRDLGEYKWRYERSAASDVLTEVITSPPKSEVPDTSELSYASAAAEHGQRSSGTRQAFYETSLFSDSFHYLQAERIGPRTAFGMSDYFVRQRRQLGSAGEYAVHYLQTWQGDPVAEELQHHGEHTSDTLLSHVIAWMNEVSPGTGIRMTPHDDMDLISLKYAFPGTDPFRSTNVGFGITYVLPILIAILSVKPGYLILLENPEAHLHPAGQAQLGNLLARAADTGAQIIVETHSDHILNGIRAAVKNRTVESDDVIIHFFRRDEGDEGMLKGGIVESIEISKHGKLTHWPPGFFDQYGKSLDELL